MSAKTKSIIGLAILFVLGMVAGIAFTLIIEGGIIKRALANPEYGREVASGRLARRLDLDPEQRAAIDEILLDAQDELEAIRTETSPEVEKVLQDSRERIDRVLDPKQKDEFDTMFHRFQEVRQRFGHMHQERRRFRGGRMGAGNVDDQAGMGMGSGYDDEQGGMGMGPGNGDEQEESGDATSGNTDTSEETSNNHAHGRGRGHRGGSG